MLSCTQHIFRPCFFWISWSQNRTLSMEWDLLHETDSINSKNTQVTSVRHFCNSMRWLGYCGEMRRYWRCFNAPQDFMIFYSLGLNVSRSQQSLSDGSWGDSIRMNTHPTLRTNQWALNVRHQGLNDPAIDSQVWSRHSKVDFKYELLPEYLRWCILRERVDVFATGNFPVSPELIISHIISANWLKPSVVIDSAVVDRGAWLCGVVLTEINLLNVDRLIMHPSILITICAPDLWRQCGMRCLLYSVGTIFQETRNLIDLLSYFDESEYQSERDEQSCCG